MLEVYIDIFLLFPAITGNKRNILYAKDSELPRTKLLFIRINVINNNNICNIFD